jgi:hypothetical protein
VTEKLVVKWPIEAWDRRPDFLVQERGMKVLDAFKDHLTEKVKTNF